MYRAEADSVNIETLAVGIEVGQDLSPWYVEMLIDRFKKNTHHKVFINHYSSLYNDKCS